MKLVYGATSLLVLIFALFTPHDADAQRLTDLQQGAWLRIKYTSGFKYEGVLASRPDTTVQLLGAEGAVSSPVKEVEFADLRVGKSHPSGMLHTGFKSGLIGFAIGAVFGAVSYRKCEPKQVFDCFLAPSSAGESALVGGAVFGIPSLLIGAAVGAVRGEDVWRRIR